MPALLFTLLLTSRRAAEEQLKGKAGELNPVRDTWWFQYGHMLLVGLVTLSARYAVYEILCSATGARPSDGVLLGALLLITVVGSIPLQATKATSMRLANRLTALLGILGLLLIFLQPPLPLQVQSLFRYIGSTQYLTLQVQQRLPKLRDVLKQRGLDL